MDFEKMKKELDDWFNSPEGEASLKKFGEDMKQKDLFNERVDRQIELLEREEEIKRGEII